MFHPIQSYEADLNPQTNSFHIVVFAQGLQPVQLPVATLDMFREILSLLSRPNVLIDDQTLGLQLVTRLVGT